MKNVKVWLTAESAIVMDGLIPQPYIIDRGPNDMVAFLMPLSIVQSVVERLMEEKVLITIEKFV